jgi:hypothetical protein
VGVRRANRFPGSSKRSAGSQSVFPSAGNAFPFPERLPADRTLACAEVSTFARARPFLSENARECRCRGVTKCWRVPVPRRYRANARRSTEAPGPPTETLPVDERLPDDRSPYPSSSTYSSSDALAGRSKCPPVTALARQVAAPKPLDGSRPVCCEPLRGQRPTRPHPHTNCHLAPSLWKPQPVTGHTITRSARPRLSRFVRPWVLPGSETVPKGSVAICLVEQLFTFTDALPQRPPEVRCPPTGLFRRKSPAYPCTAQHRLSLLRTSPHHGPPPSCARNR